MVHVHVVDTVLLGSPALSSEDPSRVLEHHSQEQKHSLLA